MSGAELNNSLARDRWGLLATVAFGMVIAGVWALAQYAVVIRAVRVCIEVYPDLPADELQAVMVADGQLAGFAYMVSAFLGLLGIAVIVWSRGGLSFESYLGFERVNPAQTATMLLVTILFLLSVGGGLDALQLGEPFVADSERVYLQSGYFPFLYWIALVIPVPFFEESYVRGFLFEGIRKSKLGVPGAIILTSVVYAALHPFAGAVALLQLFCWGLVLGVARWRTGSLWTTVIMHSFSNLLLGLSAYRYFSSL